jgi:methyl-accepting chemotaxis protein
MFRALNFGQKIALGYAVIASFVVAVSAIALYATQSIVAEKDRVITVYARNLITAGELQVEAEQRVSFARAYLLIKDSEVLKEMSQSRADFEAMLAGLRKSALSPEDEQFLTKIEQVSRSQVQAQDRIIDARRGGTQLELVAEKFKTDVIPKNQELRTAIENFVNSQEAQMEKAKTRAAELASFQTRLLMGVAGAGVVLAVLLAIWLSRLLRQQISSAVQHIQSSSSELQTAANQQTTVSREQAASMSEIATTIKELVATARQIAESAQRVAGIAEETARGARSGDQTLRAAQEAVANIRGQVDLIVSHMLDLGRKSQQIGGILEVINELAEQTNILSINASIEAAGAGDSGRRFAVVADEIRKLADRVSASSKDIRTLIDEIRGAVHTTVMATETGSKAVDAGTRQTRDVSAAFQQIVKLVETTTEAAREIELSTKQQTTAVEQVNEAIASMAQAAKESEVSSTQTLQTATELTGLSRDLARLIQSQTAA